MMVSARGFIKRGLIGVSAGISAAVLVYSGGVAYAYTPAVVLYLTTAPYLSGITQGPDGNIWYSSRSGGKVGKLSPSGTVTEYTPPSSDDTPDIVAGPDGNLWFAEYNTDKIGKITTTGAITEYTVPTSGASLYRITVGPDNNLWFVENGSNKIGKITTSGTVTEYAIPTSNSNPQGITAGPDGNLWFTETSGHKIGKITTSGTITEYAIPGGYSPSDVVTGPDGNIWFGAYESKIGKITTSGTVSVYSTSSPTFGLTIGPDGNVWFASLSGANNIGTVSSSGTVTEYPLVGDPYSFSMTLGDDNNLYMAAYESNGKVLKVVFPPKPGVPANKTVGVEAGKSVVLNLLTDVTNNPDASSVTIVNGPSHGAATVSAGSVTYIPNGGYVGADSLTYQVCATDLQTLCSQGVLGITVTAALGVPNTGFAPAVNDPMQKNQAVALAAGFCVASFAVIRRYRKWLLTK